MFGKRRVNRWLMGLLGTLLVAPAALATPGVPVGGGVLDAGWRGEYFANPALSGEPAFTRKEVRLRFGWRENLPIGGSNAEPYRSFPHDRFSARWTGTVIPRFSEPYTLRLAFDEGARLFVRPAGAGPWQTIVDSWSKRGDVKAKPYSMQAGKRYEVRVEYRNLTGPAACVVSWSSPSTPEEVIEPVAQNGLNLASWDGYIFSDRGREGRWWRIDGKEPRDVEHLLDENGWPKTDAEYIPFEASKTIRGTYLVSFKGKAELEFRLMKGTFEVNGRSLGSKLPRGEGYDPKTNTTTAKLVVAADEGTAFLNIKNSSRDGSDTTGTGIANLRILRPIDHESETPHAVTELNYRPMKRLAEVFTCLRWLGVANSKAFGQWTERTPADYRSFEKPGKDSFSRGENLESLIMFANETGRDLYLCTPVAADDAYFTKLAQLLRYGSDGREPYTSPQASPKYPPLNSNLACYIEVGNEIWNWAFASTQQAVQSSVAASEAKSPLWKAIDFDGQAGNPGHARAIRRWHALRTAAATRAFRTVFGDAGFGTRFRPVMEFQYANAQDTARASFDFMDAYLNNGAGDYVKEPHPVSYYVWGGGGAAYYGVGNPEGRQEETLIPDAGFERVAVGEAAAPAQPSGTPWKFVGTAGLFRPLNSAVPDYVSEKRMNANGKTAYGFKFRVGASPIFVHRMGRVFTGGSSGATLRIVRAADKTEVAKGETGNVSAYLTKIFGYYYTKPLERPARLERNTEYYLVATTDGASMASDDAPVSGTGPGIAVIGAAKAAIEGDGPAAWQFTDGRAGSVFGPVTFLYSLTEDARPTLPQPPYGQQGAAIFGKGELATTVDFAKPGKYALTFNAAGNDGFQVWVDDQHASAKEQHDYRVQTDPQKGSGIGGWGRNNGFKEEWGSAVFTVDKAGPHTLTLRGLGKDDQSIVFDNLRIASLDAIMASGFGAGSALGQPVENKWGDSQRTDSAFGLVYGLPRISYETGWSLGGDFYQKPIHNYAKLMDARAATINDTATTIFQKSGGFMPVWGVYTYWPSNDFAGGRDYPIMKSFIAASDHLPDEPDNGQAIPGTLTVEDAVKWQGKTDGTLDARGEYVSWTIVAPATGEYDIRVRASGDGTLDVDTGGRPLAPPFAASQAPSLKVRLTKGIHGLRVRNRSGKATVEEVQIRAAPQTVGAGAKP